MYKPSGVHLRVVASDRGLDERWYSTERRRHAAGQRSGAFALGSSGADAAVLADLGPGASTAIVSSTTGAAGVALVEVYELP